MAPSPVSGRKMRNVLVGIILGLLAVVHTTPVNTVTQIPTEAVDEVIQEEGFIVDHSFFPSLTTESPKRNTTIHASQQPSADSLSFHHEGDHYATTTQTVSHAQSSSTVSSRDSVDSSSDSSTTQSPQSGFTSSSVLSEAQSSVTQDHISVSQTSDPATALMPHEATQLLEEESGSGLGSETTTEPSTTTIALMPHEVTQLLEEESGSGLGSETTTEPSTTTIALMPHEATQLLEQESGSGLGSETSTAPSTTTTTNKVEEENQDSESGEETSTAPSTTTPIIKAGSRDNLGRIFVENKGLGSESETSTAPSTSTVAPTEQASPVIADQEAPNGHTTPGWIIILGFVVGVAALIMLLVAIATRDKWNGPNQVSQQETKADSSNQQRGVEMETFLHKEMPKENGKAAEYTVIPLDEFPENYSSH